MRLPRPNDPAAQIGGLALLEEQDSLADRGQLPSERAAAGAAANDDDVVVVGGHDHVSLVARVASGEGCAAERADPLTRLPVLRTKLAAGHCRESVTMSSEALAGQVTEGVRSLEVRWIFPGRLEAAVA